ncbi:MAG: hypothetical protein V8R85_05240 [Frisingicoccus sp.]
MKDVRRLLYVVVCAVFFIGLYILSDFYAGEAVGGNMPARSVQVTAS